MMEHPGVDTVLELLSLHARTRGSAPAIVDPDRGNFSYAALRHEVGRVGAMLAEFGLGRGNRIAVALPHGPDTAVVMLATMSWAACAPFDPSLEPAACRALLESMRVDALLAPQGEDVPAVIAARALRLQVVRLLASPERTDAILALRAETAHRRVAREPPKAHDLALVMHTSGTTGHPKIVPLSHAQLVSRARLNPLIDADRGICAAPMFT